MEVHGEASLGDEMQVDGPRRVVYVLHPNCNVEDLGGLGGQDTQVLQS
jgi:hypothetical protein